MLTGTYNNEIKTIFFFLPRGSALYWGYLSGMKREECVAPMPGRPCFTGL